MRSAGFTGGIWVSETAVRSQLEETPGWSLFFFFLSLQFVATYFLVPGRIMSHRAKLSELGGNGKINQNRFNKFELRP